MDDFDQDPDVFEWHYMNQNNYNDIEDFMFDPAKNHQFDMMDEYLENIDTPVVERYEKLSDVPRERAWTFQQRYENEARNHHYLNTNPIRIESWTADIARAHLAFSDSADSSSSKNSSSSRSSSSSSSSSQSTRTPPISTSPILRSPTQSRRPSIYATSRHKLPSPTFRRESSSSSSSSATSSFPPLTISLPNNNNPEEEKTMNEDMIDLINRHREEPTSRFSNPTKKRRFHSLQAHTVRMLSVQQQQSLQILDLGAGISGVGQQWKITNIEQAAEVTMQGAFGDPMKPTIQGLLGPDKLQAVLVPGMKDDIYSLCQLLQPNPISGSNSRIAVFTENGAIVMTLESCQSLIEKAIQQGSQTHVADHIGGTYVFRHLRLRPTPHG